MFDRKRVSKLSSRGLCYQLLEARRLLAGGQISATSGVCSAVTAPASGLNSSAVAEGESIEDGVIAGTGKQIVLTGNLPQRVHFQSADGAVLVQGWHYHQDLNLNKFAAGNYFFSAASSGNPTKNYRVEMADDVVSVHALSDGVVTLNGSFPRRVAIFNAAEQILLDHYVYSNPVNVADLQPGAYELWHAESGVNWQAQALAVFERGVELFPEIDKRIEFADAGPRRIVVQTVAGGLINSFWHYRTYLDLADYAHGEYLIRHAISGETFTDLRVSVAGTSFDVVDVTPVYYFVNLPGTLPRHIEVFDDGGNRLHSQLVHSNRVDFSFLPSGAYQVHHWNAAGDDHWVHEIALDERGVTSSGYRPVFLGVDAGTQVSIFDADRALVDQLEFQHPYYNPVSLGPGEYRFVYTNDANEQRAVDVVVDAELQVTQINVGNPHRLELSGDLPRYVSVFDGQTGRVTANWHYQSTLNLGPRADGRYLITHAASGQSATVLSVDKEMHGVFATDFTGRVDSQSIHFPGASRAVPLPGVGEVAIIEQPSRGAVAVLGDGQLLTYIPAAATVGHDWFVYQRDTEAGLRETRLMRIIVGDQRPTSLSYFAPAVGTVGLTLGMPAAMEANGELFPHDFVVINQYGPAIDYVRRDGSIGWRFQVPVGMSSVALDGDQIVFPNANRIGFLEVQTGLLTDDWLVTADTAWVRFVNPLGGGRYLLARETQSGQQILEIRNRNGEVDWTSPESIFHPRWAALSDDLVVVADTFNHRVFGIRLDAMQSEFSIPTFFPNDVRFLDADTIMVVEEHADRIWTMSLADAALANLAGRTLLIAAAGREDLSLNVSELSALASSMEVKVDPDASVSLAKSARSYAGMQTLYSPNGAVALADGSLYVADTDNHRVIHISAEGLVLGEILGFNNPTKLVPIISAF
ncbi:hypothetical protein SH139x_000450 [Planctomycetaceae bacterium SH139]